MKDLPTQVPISGNGRKPQFVICGFDYDLNREVFFRSDLDSLASSSGNYPPVTLVQAIHASSNAPVNYFDAPAKFLGARYWDGAIGGYNNPIIAAAVEAVANASRYNTTPNEINILSLGTASVVLPLEHHLPHEDPDLVQHQTEANLRNDVLKLATSILDDPPDAASFHAHVLLGGALPSKPTPSKPVSPVTNGPIVRMSPVIQPIPGSGKPWDFPPGLNRDQFIQLSNLNMDAIEQSDVDLIVVLGKAWLGNGVLNQPIRANRDTLAVEIGHRWYADAKTQATILGLI